MNTINLNNWHRSSIHRYENSLLLDQPKLTKVVKQVAQTQLHTPDQPCSALNPKLWSYVHNVHLHSSSKKLLNNIALYSGFSSVLYVLGLRAPKKVYSKISVANYKLTKGSLIGARVTLRAQCRLYFLYKMCFLSAQLNVDDCVLPKKQLQQFSIGVHNIFFIPELDTSDYDLYSKVSGLDININYKFKIFMK